MHTKERILLTALSLFAENGYEAVSVSDISGKLGITKGALYKHFKNKRDIFDSIVKRMYEIDEARSTAFQIPKEVFEVSPESYKQVSLDAVSKYTIAQFSFWTEDPFASCFRRMLSLERYRNPEMAKLYRECIEEGPIFYMEDIFREMMQRSLIQTSDPQLLALQFYAPFYLLISISDHETEKSQPLDKLKLHIQAFFRHIISV